MQTKANVQSETSVSNMHFAVVPYEVQFIVPNDQIYQLCFEKGLQILGTTQYPIENHEKLKTITIPIMNNIIPFRLFSDKNSEYQWSIYKRINEMEEFLESKKINLKEILKKQPHKRLQTEKKGFTQRKDSMTNRKGETKTSDVKAISAKKPQSKTSQNKSSQGKITQPNETQRSVDTSIQGKGCIFDQQIKSELGSFILKFYIFKTFSHQQLNKAIEQKAKQQKQSRKPASQTSVNKISDLPKISEIQPKQQQQQQLHMVTHQQETQKVEEVRQAMQTKDELQKEQIKIQSVKQIKPEPRVAQKEEIIHVDRQVFAQAQQALKKMEEQIEKGVEKPSSAKELPEKPEQQKAISNKSLPKLEQNGDTIKQPAQPVQSTASGEGYLPEQSRSTAGATTPKSNKFTLKRLIIAIIITGLLFLLQRLNLLDWVQMPENLELGKQKREKFSSRKKIKK